MPTTQRLAFRIMFRKWPPLIKLHIENFLPGYYLFIYLQ